jgi:hypothetical protein
MSKHGTGLPTNWLENSRPWLSSRYHLKPVTPAQPNTEPMEGQQHSDPRPRVDTTKSIAMAIRGPAVIRSDKVVAISHTSITAQNASSTGCCGRRRLGLLRRRSGWNREEGTEPPAWDQEELPGQDPEWQRCENISSWRSQAMHAMAHTQPQIARQVPSAERLTTMLITLVN